MQQDWAALQPKRISRVSVVLLVSIVRIVLDENSGTLLTFLWKYFATLLEKFNKYRQSEVPVFN
jgi:hypothetical protein